MVRSDLPLVAAFLLVFVVCGFVSLAGDAATSDETAHIPAGYSYLDRGDFRMNPEHPPLAKMFAALPLWLRGAGRPDYGSRAWAEGQEWAFGFAFLNGPPEDPVRRDPDRLLHPARGMILGLGVLLCLAVHRWAAALWGREGALLALALCALSPVVLAHARLVTTDLPAALGFLLTLWTFARWLRLPSWPRLALAGLALGGALLVKFTALLLVPLLVLAAAVWAVRSRSVRPLLALAGVGILAYAVLWAGYGFRFAPAPHGAYALPWERLAQLEGPHPKPLLLARDLHLAPEAYLYGLTYALHEQTRLAYLNGVESVVGWRSYFPIAFLLKTPLAFLALAAWGLALVWKGPRRREVAVFLLLPLAVYALVSVRSRLNIGHRHLLPMYPLLCIVAGAIAAHAKRRWMERSVFYALLGGIALSFGLATPGYLAYFNVLAGGARGGWRYLLDSNLDWGQDLKRLAAWQRAHGGVPLDLAYFGTADPLAYGIRHRKVVWIHDFRPLEPSVRPASGNLLAVSLNLREGLYLERDRELARAVFDRGWMSNATIRRYTDLRMAGIREAVPYPSFSAWAVREGLLTEAQVRAAEEGLLSTLFARLRDKGTPVGFAGDSIAIYRVP
ncbi:MAG TPA: glycosyltransferase family 39 protein [Candidatus Polarisedimenticolaceae bacterium]|nr:glycosyltransferase family 39 protein [Candidatus Polarisedimenticolaceae bacterium]